MGEHTEIGWTDHTFNPWIGCTKVGPGCDFCYAERDNNHRKWVSGWGAGVPRKRTSPENWRRVAAWNRQAEAFRAEHGHWPRTFVASLADVYDNEVPQFWRNDLFSTIENARNLRWQILTKRISNVEKMTPRGFFSLNPHVGLMVTVVNQAEADRDVPRLLDLKAKLGIRWVGLSCEPLLGPIDLTNIRLQNGDILNALTGEVHDPKTGCIVREIAALDWVIAGGESGRHARPMHPDWARSLRDQCQAADVPFFFKQFGEFGPVGLSSQRWIVRADGSHDPMPTPNGIGYHTPQHGSRFVYRVGKKAAGALLDGREWKQFPEALAA